jgi:hypothetical protein
MPLKITTKDFSMAANVYGWSGLDMLQQNIANAIARGRKAEQDAIAAKAREWAGNYPEASDGRNTFVLFAEWIEQR